MQHATSRLKPWLKGPNITVVESHGRGPDDIYNIFGYRSRIGWTFYLQHLEQLYLGKFEVKDVSELNTWF